MQQPISTCLLFFATVLSSTATFDSCREKVWTFAAFNDIFGTAPGVDKGQILSFALDKEVLSEVCKIAKKKCKVVSTPIRECADNVRNRFFPGRGLMDGWFDGCLRVTTTEERAATMKFTLPYIDFEADAFFVLDGNPTNFDPKGGDFIVGYGVGSSASSQCLNRNNRIFRETVAVDILDSIALVKSGQVDAIFRPAFRVEGLEQIPEPIECEIIAGGIMTRTDSLVADWFNPAFKILVSRGTYKKICQRNPEGRLCVKHIRSTIRRFEKHPLLQH